MKQTLTSIYCVSLLIFVQVMASAFTPSLMSPGSDGLRQILFGKPKGGQPGSASTADPSHQSSARIQKAYHTRQIAGSIVKYRTIYITPRAAKLDINGKEVQLQHPPLIYRGTAYVPLRDMVEVLKQYGIRASVDYLGHNEVSLHFAPVQATPNTFDYYFGAGLMDMWHGDVAEAIKQFRKAEKFGGEEAHDAKGMADWLAEEDSSAIIRFHWWNLPDDVTVFVDGKEIERGAIMAAVTAGEHELRIIGKNDTEIYNQTIQVRQGHAFVVEIIVHTRD